MHPIDRKQDPSATTRNAPPERLWVGGVATLPWWVGDEEKGSFVPEVALWIELPEGIVVGCDLTQPETVEGALGRVLRRAIDAPMVGEPRRPDRVRVEEIALAQDVRSVLPDVVVEIAPTPELDEPVASLIDAAARDEDEPGYLDRDVQPESMERLFSGAALLWRVIRWDSVDEGAVLRVDIPALGVKGACLSIIGALGESRGFLLFPSLDHFLAFGESAGRNAGARDGRIDMGTELLSLTFERGADLPDSMRREIAEHEWSVAAAEAHPVPEARRRDGMPGDLTDADVRVLAACATSLGAFLGRNGIPTTEVDREPVSASFTDDDDLVVRFTYPYEAYDLFEPERRPMRPAPRRRQPAHGRNKPCPCGSGKKYKLCCLPREEAEAQTGSAPRGSSVSAPTAVSAPDAEPLALRILQFAQGRFGRSLRGQADFFVGQDGIGQILVRWTIFHADFDGQPAYEWFLNAHGRTLSPNDRAELHVQRDSWLSLWEVFDVEAGRSLSLRDPLSGEVREVQERTASRSLRRRDVVLGRVVRDGDTHVLDGIHPRSLPPREASWVEERMRAKLRRKRDVPVDRLRDAKITRYLIERWEDAIASFDHRRSIPPIVRNTDGHDLLFTTDRFAIEPGSRDEIARRIAGMKNVGEEADSGGGIYVFGRPSRKSDGEGGTVIGRVSLAEEGLLVETNSVERADLLRARLEKRCGNLIAHESRECHEPPLPGSLPGAERSASPPGSGAPAEELAMLLKVKTSHYSTWPDEPLPALGGLSPRKAVRTAAGRRAVDVLLKEMESMEQLAPEGARFDFGEIRRVLWIE